VVKMEERKANQRVYRTRIGRFLLVIEEFWRKKKDGLSGRANDCASRGRGGFGLNISFVPQRGEKMYLFHLEWFGGSGFVELWSFV
jgi:hypothetical protein